MEYADLLKKSVTDLETLCAEKSEELRALRFSFSEKNTQKTLAVRRELSRIQTALKSIK